MAITGSILDAIPAGMIPANTPIILDTLTPIIIFFILIVNAKDPKSTKVSKNTKNIPISPPKTLKNTDSKRNLYNINNFLRLEIFESL